MSQWSTDVQMSRLIDSSREALRAQVPTAYADAEQLGQQLNRTLIAARARLMQKDLFHLCPSQVATIRHRRVSLYQGTSTLTRS